MGFEIDFLPVGNESRSGDAILLRFGDLFASRAEQTVVLIDGGFRETADEILDHLNKYYKTQTIDLVISTHPDADHINGLREIFDRIGEGSITVKELWLHRPSLRRATVERGLRKAARLEYLKAVKGALDAATELERAAVKHGIPMHEPFAGLAHHSGYLEVVGPSMEFLRVRFRG